MVVVDRQTDADGQNWVGTLRVGGFQREEKQHGRPALPQPPAVSGHGSQRATQSRAQAGLPAASALPPCPAPPAGFLAVTRALTRPGGSWDSPPSTHLLRGPSLVFERALRAPQLAVVATW